MLVSKQRPHLESECATTGFNLCFHFTFVLALFHDKRFHQQRKPGYGGGRVNNTAHTWVKGGAAARLATPGAATPPAIAPRPGDTETGGSPAVVCGRAPTAVSVWPTTWTVINWLSALLWDPAISFSLPLSLCALTVFWFGTTYGMDTAPSWCVCQSILVRCCKQYLKKKTTPKPPLIQSLHFLEHGSALFRYKMSLSTPRQPCWSHQGYCQTK